MNGTIYTLITFNTQIDFLYTYTFNQRSFTLDTREFKNILEGVPLNNPKYQSIFVNFLTKTVMKLTAVQLYRMRRRQHEITCRIESHS